MSQLNHSRRSRSIRRIVAVVVILVVLPTAFIIYRATRNRTPQVRTAVLETGDITSVMTINTVIRPGAVQKTFINREKVSQVFVTPGDQVSKGDVLVTFDLTELEDQLKAAQDLRAQAEDAAAQAESIIAEQGESSQESVQALQKQISKLTAGLSGATQAFSALSGVSNPILVDIDEGLAEEIAAQLAEIDPSSPDAVAQIQAVLDSLSTGIQISSSAQVQEQLGLLGQNLNKMSSSLTGLLGSLSSTDSLTALLGGGSLTSQLANLGASAQSAVAQAEQAEKLAQQALDNAVESITAEMDGIVAEINAKPGEYAGTADTSTGASSLLGLNSSLGSLGSLTSGQTPVVVIYDNTHPKAYFQANRYDSAKLAVGMPVIYSQDGKTWHGEITFKSRIAGNAGLSGSDSSTSLLGDVSAVSGLTSEPMIDLEMSIEGENLTDLTLGFNLDAEIQTASASGVLLLPAESLKKELGEYYVFIVGVDNRLIRRVVTPGIQSDLYSEIREGLNVGDRVVLNPTNDLSEGLLVQEKTNG